MDEIRRGQIAMLLVKRQIHEKKIHLLSPDSRRSLGNEAKAIGISTKELMEFLEPIIREMVDETFSLKTTG